LGISAPDAKAARHFTVTSALKARNWPHHRGRGTPPTLVEIQQQAGTHRGSIPNLPRAKRLRLADQNSNHSALLTAVTANRCSQKKKLRRASPARLPRTGGDTTGRKRRCAWCVVSLDHHLRRHQYHDPIHHLADRACGDAHIQKSPSECVNFGFLGKSMLIALSSTRMLCPAGRFPPARSSWRCPSRDDSRRRAAALKALH